MGETMDGTALGAAGEAMGAADATRCEETPRRRGGCGRAAFAMGFASRLRGLVGKPGFEGLLVLAPCRDIHTWGMRAAIDVAFVDEGGRVLQSCRALPPRRRLRNRRAAFAVERIARPDESWFVPGERVCLAWGREQS